jgi:hypothetical protein
LIPVLVTVITAVIFYGSERFREGVSPILAIYGTLGAFGMLTALTSSREMAVDSDDVRAANASLS